MRDVQKPDTGAYKRHSGDCFRSFSDAVIETLSGEKTVAQICRKRNIDQALLSRWKQEFLARGPAIFESGAARKAGQKDSRVAELERLVGRLTLEREILKRTGGLAVSSRRRNR